MGDIPVTKLAGYSLIVGPILALVCYFIQPGGILGIGGATADPTDSAAVVKLLADNSELGTLTSLLIPVGVLVFLSGIMFFVQNMAGGSGHAVARLGLPMVMAGIFGWVLSSAVSMAISAGVATDAGANAIFAINTIAALAFGAGLILIAIGASTREEINSNLAYIATLSGVVVVVSSVVTAFSPDSAQNMTAVTGVAFIVGTLWFILI
jgi:ribosomal protein L30E